MTEPRRGLGPRFRDAIVAVVAIALVASGIRPHDRLTWALEVSWVVVGLALYPFFRRARRPTDLLLVLLAAHALVLIWGGYHTYALEPVGAWFQSTFGLARNHYDRLGHLFQGFVPAILAREILIRNRVVTRRGWLAAVVVSMCIAFSASFELLEWLVAVILGDGSTAYLATQGDPWDPQKDMLCAAIGAIAAVVALSRWQDAQLRRIGAVG